MWMEIIFIGNYLSGVWRLSLLRFFWFAKILYCGCNKVRIKMFLVYFNDVFVNIV